MEVQELLTGARDALSVRRVYGEPYEKDGLTVIPAAAVRGGGGAGQGEKEGGESGAGGGFGVVARPAGAWIIEDGRVSWKPAVDATRVVVGAQILALAAVLVGGRIVFGRTRRRRPARALRARLGRPAPRRMSLPRV